MVVAIRGISGVRCLKSRSLDTHPIVGVTKVVAIVLKVLSGFIWMFGLEHARGLELDNAAKVVAVPLAVTIGFTVATIV